MRLDYLRLINFECFKDSKEIPFHNLTIFIGENDCGKTCILKALDLFFKKGVIQRSHFHELNEVIQDKLSIEISFKLSDEDLSKLPQECIIDKKITFKRTAEIDQNEHILEKYLVLRYVFEKEELNNYKSLPAPEMKEVFKELGLNYTNLTDAKEELADYININFEELSKNTNFFDMSWNEVAQYLPGYEYYESNLIGNPQKLIETSLKNVYRSFFYEYDENGNELLKEDLKDKKAKIVVELNKRIQEDLKDKVKSKINKVTNISGEYSIDFAGGFQLAGLMIDYGSGLRPINNIGDGSKKRLFLSITEWDKEIRSKEKQKMMIRAYDEPDSSLHYLAQKEIYYTLKKLSENSQANFQVIIATHSLSMIDRAPPRLINQVTQDDGISDVKYLKEEGEEDIKDFLDNISGISGIKNSSLFFERCFLIIEGFTEENFIPNAYKSITDHTLSEDGICLINIQGNATWDKFLKLLNKNKSEATILVLDKDSQENKSSNVTEEKLKRIGLSQNFLSENVLFVGKNEFEDIFPDEIIVRCLNKYWPKKEGEVWEIDEIRALRNLDSKFSEDILKKVNSYKQENGLNWEYFNKPRFGLYLSEIMIKDEIFEIDEIKKLFDLIAKIIA